jgi:GTP-binding protein Era
MTRAGLVAVVGRPNAGKSTLLNRIVGQKLSITSEKPQSTRDRVVGIRSTEQAQMVILDTPGLLDPKYALQQAMRGTAIAALTDADVVVYLNDARDGVPPSIEEAAGLETPVRTPVITALNKIDALNAVERDAIEAAVPEAMLISALTGEGVDALLMNVEALLPESPFLYPDEDISTQSMRFFASELVRETALEQLSEEVPYSIACEIEEFREDRDPVYIRAVIYVERESQKRIFIGDKGRRIRDIGSAARAKIENLVGSRVYLDLWVKVLQNWRRDAAALRRFGYNLPSQSS